MHAYTYVYMRVRRVAHLHVEHTRLVHAVREVREQDVPSVQLSTAPYNTVQHYTIHDVLCILDRGIQFYNSLRSSIKLHNTV